MKLFGIALSTLTAGTGIALMLQARSQPAIGVSAIAQTTAETASEQWPIYESLDIPGTMRGTAIGPETQCTEASWQVLMPEASDGQASADDISGGTNHRAQANLIGTIEGYSLIAYLSTRENVVRVSVVHPPESNLTQSFVTPDLEPLLGECARLGRSLLLQVLQEQQ